MSITESDIEDFYDHHAGHELNRPETVDEYITWIRRFELWRGPDVNEEEVRQFDSLLKDPDRTDYPWTNDGPGRPPGDEYAFETRKKMVKALKYWLPWQYDVELDTPPADVCEGEPEPFDPTIIEEDAIHRTIRNAPDVCNADGCSTAMQLSYDAIMRGIELTRVRREDVNLGDGTILVRAAKGSVQSTISLSGETISTLQTHLDRHPNWDESLFRNTYGRPWKPQSWNNHVRRQHHPAGTNALFRHSAIAHRLNSGEAFGDVFRRARHTYPSQTAKYGRVVDTEIPGWANPR